MIVVISFFDNLDAKEHRYRVVNVTNCACICPLSSPLISFTDRGRSGGGNVPWGQAWALCHKADTKPRI